MLDNEVRVLRETIGILEREKKRIDTDTINRGSTTDLQFLTVYLDKRVRLYDAVNTIQRLIDENNR